MTCFSYIVFHLPSASIEMQKECSHSKPSLIFFKLDFPPTPYHFVSQLRIVKSSGFHLEKPPDLFGASFEP